MAPFALPTANGSHPTSANVTVGIGSPSPRPTPCQNANQNQWGPDSISNVVFGLVMVFLSLFAIHQTRKQCPSGSRCEEKECREAVDGEDPEPAAWGFSSEKSSTKEMLGRAGKDVEGGGGFVPQARGFTRTNTDVTLVDGN